MNSCRKGKVGEREWAAFLTEHGFTARRGQQHAGGPDSPDVVCPDLPQFHFEVKRVEALRLNAALDQAITEAGQGQTPIVAWRQNQRPWVVFLRAEDFLRLIARAEKHDADVCNRVIVNGSFPAKNAFDTYGNSGQGRHTCLPVGIARGPISAPRAVIPPPPEARALAPGNGPTGPEFPPLNPS
jgi:Holliday junction resolvase